ncbi:octopine/nopaline transport system permease protein [Rhizobium sp. BK619]|uniref:Polar amino acid ABC transporter, inner membrane subunit n=1 Tax=Rhizobium leguminosarum bv. trifolii (strain WSM2304) TaxID=395492 RepID=A0ABF7QV12_RHILW|nr:ABC transporter permease subunit [Rhizobium leguminosarum]ACI58164.1 polar amino acid ABC transporter, inner membrane subunit [Rhizobium leguminosarum bv. trifolii WSM2304]MBB3649731.1 octopine/nopaline transport system permease protein [Rhizobium sp. BK619]
MYEFIDQLLYGLKNTILVFVLSCVLGTGLGLLIAILRNSRRKIIAASLQAYTAIIRGVPELLIILLMYFGGTALLSAVFGGYVEINAFAAGVTALTIVFSAYAAEIFRGAINAIAPGQSEAAMSLGLPQWQIWLLVIIPQMVPIALPAFCNLCISLIKDTSLISVVGLTDVMRVAYVGAGSLRAPLPFYLAASAIYLTLTSLSLLSFKLIERHYAIPFAKRLKR